MPKGVISAATLIDAVLAKAHAHPGVGLKNASRAEGVERSIPENDQCVLQISMYAAIDKLVPPSVMLKPSVAKRNLPLRIIELECA